MSVVNPVGTINGSTRHTAGGSQAEKPTLVPCSGISALRLCLMTRA